MYPAPDNMFIWLSSLLLSIVSVTASPVGHWKQELKEVHPVPKKWIALSDAPGDHVLKVDIALRQSQFDQLEKELYEVSDPDHPRYGHHLAPRAVQKLIKPTDIALREVHDWLAAYGIDEERLRYSKAKDWISLHLPIATLEGMLHTKYSIFRHEDGELAIRTHSGEWSLPSHLHDHIELISPTNSFFRPKPRKSSLRPVKVDDHAYGNTSPLERMPSHPTVETVCNETSVTSLCLRTYYETYGYTPQVPGKNKVALSDYLGESNNRSDARIFLQKFRPDAVSGADTFNFVSINGGPDYQKLNGSSLQEHIELEGDLEVETIIGISYPTPLTAYTTGGSPPFQPDRNTPVDDNEPYLDWLNYVLAQDTLPQAISNSYDDDEQSVPYSYAQRVCAGMAQLGARGVSVFFPSGDSGVGPNGTCVSNDGRNASTFLPVFPSSCPYVTTVGGTMHFNPEITAFGPPNNYVLGFSDGFVSGGGFSNHFSRPCYQDGVIDNYIASLNGRYDGLYNKNGRAYPDIATQSVSIATIWNGTLVHVDGTKCGISTSIFGLVNDALIASGKPPMGFLNPWLYKRGYTAMNDVLSGSSVGCNTAGFPAQKGWDAVTGFGSPMFERILKLVLR